MTYIMILAFTSLKDGLGFLNFQGNAAQFGVKANGVFDFKLYYFLIEISSQVSPYY